MTSRQLHVRNRRRRYKAPEYYFMEYRIPPGYGSGFAFAFGTLCESVTADTIKAFGPPLYFKDAKP